MVTPVIAVPVLVAVMLDSRPNSGTGSQRPHTDGGGSAGRYGTVPVAVRRAGRHERKRHSRQGEEARMI